MSKEAEKLKAAIDGYRAVHGTDQARVAYDQLRATVATLLRKDGGR